jgi:hypothetical protein
MPPDNGEPGWLKNLQEAARRAGLWPAEGQRPEDFKRQLAERGPAFIRQLALDIAAQSAARPDPDGLEPWQREAVVTFWTGLAPVVAATLYPRMPQTALLITVGTDHTATVAVDEDVVVKVTVTGGRTLTMRPTQVVEAGGRMLDVERVETVGSSLGYVLWAGRWPAPHTLLAWDFRDVALQRVSAECDHLLARLRGIGAGLPSGWGLAGAHARNEREATLKQLDSAQQRAVMQQAVEEELLDPTRRHLALRGILRAGAPAIWDAGGTAPPRGVLGWLSTLLRQERRRLKQEQREHEGDEGLADEVAEPPLDLERIDLERVFWHFTKALRGKEREAVRHAWRAEHIEGLDLVAYCARHGLSYPSTQRAAHRGFQRLARLRKKM